MYIFEGDFFLVVRIVFEIRISGSVFVLVSSIWKNIEWLKNEVMVMCNI